MCKINWNIEELRKLYVAKVIRKNELLLEEFLSSIGEKKYRATEPDTIHQRALRIIRSAATFSDRFVPDHDDLAKLIDAFRSMGCVIVLTIGVWDLIHIGHLKYISLGRQEASKLYPKADQIIMIVGVDTDELTKQRKGPDRPIVLQENYGLQT